MLYSDSSLMCFYNVHYTMLLICISSYIIICLRSESNKLYCLSVCPSIKNIRFIFRHPTLYFSCWVFCKQFLYIITLYLQQQQQQQQQ